MVGVELDRSISNRVGGDLGPRGDRALHPHGAGGAGQGHGAREDVLHRGPKTDGEVGPEQSLWSAFNSPALNSISQPPTAWAEVWDRAGTVLSILTVLVVLHVHVLHLGPKTDGEVARAVLWSAFKAP